MPEFLPISRADMTRRGWDQCDFVYIIGDGYVDHPSFGHAIISRVLEDAGYKVGILSQPDWKDPASIDALGEPRLGFLVMGGNMDSMVNHYTVSKAHRKTDAYTPGGIMGKRPDYAVTVYCNLIRRTYRRKPIIIGGIEASLRRLAHYDYWSDKRKRSILLDSQADLLIYGMGERAVVQIADALNHTEADVQRALAYWQRAGVLGTEVGEEAQRSFQETPGQQISPVSASTESLAGAGSFAPSTKTAAREAAACDMSRLTSDESFKQLIYIAQQYLNKLLTPTDCQILGNLYSNLGFSGELLEYLIEYCVQNHHTSLRYMEKVALGWHKRGIKDVEQAKASGRGYTKGSFAVMRAMGLSDRSPAEVESEFIEKWFWEYGFTRELIVEACSRTIRQIHKPSFDYADKILRDWKNAGVKSFRDVSELDKKRKEEGGAKRRQASAGSSRSSNRFHNLEEHGYDYDEMVWSMINGAQKTGGDDGTQ